MTNKILTIDDIASDLVDGPVSIKRRNGVFRVEEKTPFMTRLKSSAPYVLGVAALVGASLGISSNAHAGQDLPDSYPSVNTVNNGNDVTIDANIRHIISNHDDSDMIHLKLTEGVLKGSSLLYSNIPSTENFGVNLNFPLVQIIGGIQNSAIGQDWAKMSMLLRNGLENEQNTQTIGVDYQKLDTDTRLAVIAGLTLFEQFKVQQMIDFDSDFRTVVFYEPGDEKLISLGGGTDRNHGKELNASFGTRLNTDYVGAAYVRIGEEWHDARVIIGRDLKYNKNFYSLSVFGQGLNNMGLPDKTSVLRIDDIDLAYGYSALGETTGDFAFDVRAQAQDRSFVMAARNMGDFGIINDVAPIVEIGYNKNDGTMVYMRIGAGTKMGNTGLSARLQSTFEESEKPLHQLLVGYQGLFSK